MTVAQLTAELKKHGVKKAQTLGKTQAELDSMLQEILADVDEDEDEDILNNDDDNTDDDLFAEYGAVASNDNNFKLYKSYADMVRAYGDPVGVTDFVHEFANPANSEQIVAVQVSQAAQRYIANAGQANGAASAADFFALNVYKTQFERTDRNGAKSMVKRLILGLPQAERHSTHGKFTAALKAGVTAPKINRSSSVKSLLDNYSI